MSINSELAALRDHVDQACQAAQAPGNTAPEALTRAVTVIDREVTGYWQGTYPLVEILWLDRPLATRPGGTYAPMVQDLRAPGLYVLRIRSVSDPDNGIQVDDAQTELHNVLEAIEAWFSVVSHRTLADGSGAARVQYAGPPIRWRNNPQGPYAVADGTLGQVAAGSISVISLPRQVTP